MRKPAVSSWTEHPKIVHPSRRPHVRDLQTSLYPNVEDLTPAMVLIKLVFVEVLRMTSQELQQCGGATALLMSSVSIREAVIQDAEELARVHILAWQETYRGIAPQSVLDSLDVNARIDSWKTWLNQEDHKAFVAVVDGNICGFIRGGPVKQPVRDPSFDAELYAINIIGDAKGKGTGRELVHHLVETLRPMGLSKMVVWVLAENPSRRFYERLGAQDLGQQKIQHVGGVELTEVAYGWQDIESL
ncbi:putative N-acetyltransferase [Hyphodiscus hymeniophilus]|uniref:N-acetyltransferase n=1 Tax=Hyphodiscus hymeniophilus TaxID=353542 RepID=A0A9P6VDV3_9HELO|nr:putative N-acetyltransferase [Hyphodiscus hymeniophilus]